MLIHHSEAIEADLARFYPRDADQLDRFYSGRMTWRRLWVLVSQLPPDSATRVDMAGSEVALWTTLVELTAQTVDSIKQLDFHFMSANSQSRVQPPAVVPRPQELISNGKDPRSRTSRR
jgi:hypothetical protein